METPSVPHVPLISDPEDRSRRRGRTLDGTESQSRGARTSDLNTLSGLFSTASSSFHASDYGDSSTGHMRDNDDEPDWADFSVISGVTSVGVSMVQDLPMDSAALDMDSIA